MRSDASTKRRRRRRTGECGFGLLKSLITILTTVSLRVAQLFAVALLANRTAKDKTSTCVLALEKMEPTTRYGPASHLDELAEANSSADTQSPNVIPLHLIRETMCPRYDSGADSSRARDKPAAQRLDGIRPSRHLFA